VRGDHVEVLDGQRVEGDGAFEIAEVDQHVLGAEQLDIGKRVVDDGSGDLEHVAVFVIARQSKVLGHN